MTAKRVFFVVIIGVAAVITLTGFGFYFVSQQLSHRAVNLSKLKADIDAVDVRIEDAQNALAQFEELRFIDEIANDVLPPDKVQSDLIGELYALSSNAGVTIRLISFEAPGGTQVSDPSLTQTKALEGVSGVFVLPASIAYDTPSYNNFLRFLANLEENRRKLQVSRLSVSPVTETIPGGATLIIGYQGQIELNVYVRP